MTTVNSLIFQRVNFRQGCLAARRNFADPSHFWTDCRLVDTIIHRPKGGFRYGIAMIFESDKAVS